MEAYLENSKEHVEHREPLEALKQRWFVRMRFKDFIGSNQLYSVSTAVPILQIGALP